MSSATLCENFSQFKMFNWIGGSEHSSNSNEQLSVHHKFLGYKIFESPLADENSVEKALECAQKLFKDSREIKLEVRLDALNRLNKLIAQQQERFVTLITAETGKPISLAKAEVRRAGETISHYLNILPKWETGEYLELKNSAKAKAHLRHFPIGPLFALSPFNFPLNLCLHKLAPAIALGNPIILQHSPHAPLTGTFLAKLCQELSLPAGMIQSLMAPIPLIHKIVKDQRVPLISFTGSDKVGFYLQSLAPMKKFILECGGNAAILIDELPAEKKEIEKMANSIAQSCYLFAGQICISTQRIYIKKSLYPSFKDHLIQATLQIRTGDPDLENTQVGPIISHENFLRIEQDLEELKNTGSNFLVSPKLDFKGNLISPALLTCVPTESALHREEIFGPLALIETYEDFAEGIRMVNNSRFGLQASLYSSHPKKIEMAYKDLQVGALIVNQPPHFRQDHLPYGGVKASGLGREGGVFCLREMSEPKMLVNF